MKSKRKFIFMLTRSLYIVWTILLISILVIIIERTYAYAKYIGKQEAIVSVNKDIAYRRWVASHGGVYVPVDKRTQPNKYLSNLKDRDFKAINKEFTLMNPAYTLSQMMWDYSKLYGVKTKITSNKLLNPNNKADTWETLALDKIEQSRENYSELTSINDKEYLRLMSPLITTKSCLKCHAFQGYKIGDIRGGVSVAIPMKKLYADAKNTSLIFLVFFLIIWLVGALSISFFAKRIYKYIDEKETLYEEYIYGLVSVVEKRDTYTAGHSTRVADYAELIAKEMDYSEHDCHILHRAGMLHDIGKVAIPDSVFLKPTKLSNHEYKLIQEHVTMSYEMLKNISIFDEIKEIIRDHHEHYDGNGYPRGLTGDDTPMLAQILTLADSFDAMTTDRIYKGRKSIKEAILEIAKLSGKQFNPKVVKAALIALKDITIDDTKHQNPKTMLEVERFSYFYKDVLTGAYNEYYLRSNLHSFNKCKYLCWISLKHFHEFNKENGWSSGDKVLQELSNVILYGCKDENMVYRFYGDNFFILLNEEEDISRLKIKVENILTLKKISYSLKTASLLDVDMYEMEGLEDVIKKFF